MMGHIIFNAYRKAVAWCFCLQVVKDSKNLIRSKVLGGTPVTASHDKRGILCAIEGMSDIKQQRIGATRFLGAIQYGNALNAVRKFLDQMLRQEWAIEMDVDYADFFSPCYKRFYGFFNNGSSRPHADDNVLCIRGASIVEETVVAPGKSVDIVHAGFHNIGKRIVIGAGRFAQLEEDIGVLSCAAENGMLRRERSLTELFDCAVVDHIGEILVIPDFDLMDFVRCTETGEEEKEGNTASDSCKMST